MSAELKIVDVPTIQNPIQPSPGFQKKALSDYKLDLLGLCGFGCRYCSSNSGTYLRRNRQRFADVTEEQIGVRVLPGEEPSLTFRWPDVIGRLEAQLDRKRAGDQWGRGSTIVFSMLTDGFSPHLVASGTTERALRLLAERTSFRIRILTKNAVVGTKKWIRFFDEYPGRFVVGLSTGTLDDEWAQRIEIGTSSPSARLRAFWKLNAAGVPTYGMLCPIFPDVLFTDRLDELIGTVAPDFYGAETVWAEPFNDRCNWRLVRDGYETGSYVHRWFDAVYGNRRRDLWSRYATDLFLALHDEAEQNGWLHKLRFLLYEDWITPADAERIGTKPGLMLQSKPGEDGRSRNPAIAAIRK